MSLRSLVASMLFGASQVAAASSVYATSKCAQFNHPEFQLSISNKAVPPQDISWLLSWLEERVANHERFKTGETIQIGWMLTMLSDGPNGTLRITEPDMKSVPIRFVDSVDNTLIHLRSQKDSIESISKGIPLVFPSVQQSVVVHKNYKKADHLLLDRAAAEGTDSGWWVSDLDDRAGGQDPNNFLKISLFQLAIDRPDLIKFFAFPPSYKVVLNKRGVAIIKDDKELPLVPGSFLSELTKVTQ